MRRAITSYQFDIPWPAAKATWQPWNGHEKTGIPGPQALTKHRPEGKVCGWHRRTGDQGVCSWGDWSWVRQKWWESVIYLPLHSVINPIKGIFDCAAQHTAVSLNSKVIQGPDLTNKLVGVLTHFCPPSGTDGWHWGYVPPGPCSRARQGCPLFVVTLRWHWQAPNLLPDDCASHRRDLIHELLYLCLAPNTELEWQLPSLLQASPKTRSRRTSMWTIAWSPSPPLEKPSACPKNSRAC